MLSGKDERPAPDAIEACNVTHGCEDLGPGEKFYEILNINHRLIGYVNSREAMEIEAYNQAVQIDIKYQHNIEAFWWDFTYIRCHKCRSLISVSNLDATLYSKFKRFIEYHIKHGLHGYEEGLPKL